jgi:methanogenic corrinoid protein MtbC1
VAQARVLTGITGGQAVERTGDELAEFETALLALDRLAATRVLIRPGSDVTPMQRIERIVIPTLEKIGQDWETGRLALSQVYMSGRICEEIVDQLLPPAVAPRKGDPVMALAVLEDYHLLGKRIVYSTLRASGYQLKDYGRRDAGSLVESAAADGIEILLISTLMLPSALRVAKVKEGLEKAGSRAKVVVGGAPFRLDAKLWQDVGADAMGATASDVVPIIVRLAGGMQ